MPTTIPTTTSSTRPGSPSTGDAYFETDTNNYIIYDGANWRGYEADSQTLPAITNTYSLSFDGSNDYLDTGSKYDFIQQTSTFSISFWLKFTNHASTAIQALLSSNYTGSLKGLFVFYDNRFGNKTLKAQNSASSVVTLEVNNGITDNDWHHIGITSLSGGDFKLYRDSSLIDSLSAPATTTTSANNNLRIGRSDASGGAYYFGGLIDEVSIFNTELSGTQVAEIYNSGTPNDIDSLNPRSWWRMGDSNSGTGNVTDDGLLGNTATVNGATYVSGAGNTPS
jgi:hypothetical protein